MKLFLLILVAAVSADQHFLSYSKPGNYVLGPTQYGNANVIRFQMWSSGGSGSCTTAPNMTGAGGGSGGYLEATVDTRNQQMIYTIKVGKANAGNNGGDTSIVSDQSNLLVFAGKNAVKTVPGDKGFVGSTVGSIHSFSEDGQEGGNGTHYSNGAGGPGGRAPFGGWGGRGGAGKESGSMFGQDGGHPGGGGGGSLYCGDTDWYGSGADGLVLAYFMSDFHKQT